jgi:hypothetical protein
MTDTSGEILPAVDCADWCERGDGHTNVTHPDDQYCHSEAVTVPLSRYSLLTYGANYRVRDYVTGVVYREAGASAAHVALSHHGETMIELSTEEAKQLGTALLNFAKTASA